MAHLQRRLTTSNISINFLHIIKVLHITKHSQNHRIDGSRPHSRRPHMPISFNEARQWTMHMLKPGLLNDYGSMLPGSQPLHKSHLNLQNPQPPENIAWQIDGTQSERNKTIGHSDLLLLDAPAPALGEAAQVVDQRRERLIIIQRFILLDAGLVDHIWEVLLVQQEVCQWKSIACTQHEGLLACGRPRGDARRT